MFPRDVNKTPDNKDLKHYVQCRFMTEQLLKVLEKKVLQWKIPNLFS
jgi:hypothetical protein